MALDNQLDILTRNIEIQSNALEIVKLQKIAGVVTELAVRRFEAQVFKTRSLQFEIQQKIIVAQNRINFLTGRYPQPTPRGSQTFNDLIPDAVTAGIPTQLLTNRPDIKQAELELMASTIDVKVAKTYFLSLINDHRRSSLRSIQGKIFGKNTRFVNLFSGVKFGRTFHQLNCIKSKLLF